MSQQHVLPLFYLNTSSDILAIPEPVLTSDDGHSVEPHSFRVIIYTLPALTVTAQRSVVTVMISGIVISSKVMATEDVSNLGGNIVLYTSYSAGGGGQGILYLTEDDDRTDLLTRMNIPDYQVVILEDNNTVQPTNVNIVTLQTGVILKVPVREIERFFSSVLASTDILIAPGILTLRKANTSGESSAFISLPSQYYAFISSAPINLSASIIFSVPDQPQLPVKMTGASWTVIGFFWAVTVICFLISIGITYSWYLKDIL